MIPDYYKLVFLIRSISGYHRALSVTMISLRHQFNHVPLFFYLSSIPRGCPREVGTQEELPKTCQNYPGGDLSPKNFSPSEAPLVSGGQTVAHL